MNHTRREVLAGLGLATLAAAAPPLTKRSKRITTGNTCPFRLAVINDEITQDFERACQIVSQDFGLQWIELRGMWNKNVTDLNDEGNRRGQQNPRRPQPPRNRHRQPALQNRLARRAASTQSQDATNSTPTSTPPRRKAPRPLHLPREILQHRAHPLFRLLAPPRPKPYRAAINAKLQKAAERCAKSTLILLLENEMSCNTATGAEAAATLAAIPNKNFMLNWDPGNAAALGNARPTPTDTISSPNTASATATAKM